MTYITVSIHASIEIWIESDMEIDEDIQVEGARRVISPR